MPLLKSSVLYALTMSPTSDETEDCQVHNSRLAKTKVDNRGATKVNVVSTSFAWTIHDFSICAKKPGEFLESPVFSSRTHDQPKWKLQLYPRGMSVEEQDHVALFLCLVSCDGPEVEAKYKFSVLNAKLRESNKRKGAMLFVQANGEEEAWGARKFLKRDFLMNRKNGLLVGDDLTIVCRVSAGIDEHSSSAAHVYETIVPKGYIGSRVQHHDTTAAPVEYHQLSEDLGLLLNDQRYSDVVLESFDGVRFWAHKAILAARSKVFSSMFQQDSTERHEVKLEDVDSKVLAELLRYMYTGRILSHHYNMAENLFRAADKYEIKGLKASYERLLGDNLSVDSAVDVLLIADNHCAGNLKKRVVDFIAAHARAVIKHVEFKSAEKTHPDLVIEALRKSKYY